MIKRTVAVVQNRGSAHDEAVRQITIDSDGMHIGAPVAGIDEMEAAGLDAPARPGVIGDDI